ncbi:MAG: DUF4190 domain-containing protein [Mycobacteriales bacterium]
MPAAQQPVAIPEQPFFAQAAPNVLPQSTGPSPSNVVPQTWPAKPQGYGAPRYPSPSTGTDGLAIASLVLGLLWIGGAGSVGAIVTGHLSRSKANREGRQPSGMALAGLILGYIGATFLVVGVLAAIAIPVFLDQRVKGTDAAVRANLRSAAIAEEAYATSHGTYTGDLAALRATGFAETDGVEVAVLDVGARSYCLGGRKLGRTYYYDSTTGGLTTTACA